MGKNQGQFKYFSRASGGNLIQSFWVSKFHEFYRNKVFKLQELKNTSKTKLYYDQETQRYDVVHHFNDS